MDTPASLLERLRRPTDEAAWDRFVRLYTPLIYTWARRAGLQSADAADLVKEVLTTLVRTLPEFTYQKQQSFRAWLRTVTLNKWRDRCRRLAARPPEGATRRCPTCPRQWRSRSPRSSTAVTSWRERWS